MGGGCGCGMRSQMATSGLAKVGKARQTNEDKRIGKRGKLQTPRKSGMRTATKPDGRDLGNSFLCGVRENILCVRMWKLGGLRRARSVGLSAFASGKSFSALPKCL